MAELLQDELGVNETESQEDEMGGEEAEIREDEVGEEEDDGAGAEVILESSWRSATSSSLRTS